MNELGKIPVAVIAALAAYMFGGSRHERLDAAVRLLESDLAFARARSPAASRRRSSGARTTRAPSSSCCARTTCCRRASSRA